MGNLNEYILGNHQYQVTAKAVVVRLANGQESYVYRHGLIPATADPGAVEHLLELGMVRQLATTATAPTPVPAQPAAVLGSNVKPMSSYPVAGGERS